MKDVCFAENFWQKIEELSSNTKQVHLVMIATKPDIIKQAPLYLELKKRGAFVLLGHTGQHYDFNLSEGMLEEFGLTVDFNLNIEGFYHQKISQIISRLGDIFAKMKELGKEVIPYVHGDTMTAMAASNAAWANEIGCVHVEGGIRTLTPKKEYLQQLSEGLSFDNWRTLLLKESNWERGSIEPYPEQFNTRTTEPASGLICLPHSLYKKTITAEGFPEDRSIVTGNTVVDATMKIVQESKNSDIFEKYPILEKGFIRFCIHRQENCRNKQRFTVLFDAMEQLVEKGETILFISLYATEAAIDRFGLRDRLEKLKQKEHFVYSSVWPYYRDVIAAMQKAFVCATDSGSMQEEMNILGIPTVTLRYGSDRTESVLAGGNIIAPPMDANTIVRIIEGAKTCENMKNVGNIYGENPSEKIVDEVVTIIKNGGSFFRYEEDRLNLSK